MNIIILLCILRVTGSNLGPDTGYFNWNSLSFSSFPPLTAVKAPNIRQPLFHHLYNSFISYLVIQHYTV